MEKNPTVDVCWEWTCDNCHCPQAAYHEIKEGDAIKCNDCDMPAIAGEVSCSPSPDLTGELVAALRELVDTVGARSDRYYEFTLERARAVLAKLPEANPKETT